MQMADELGLLCQDKNFADLYPPQGQPAEAPLRLVLVTLLQFMQGLTDARRRMRCAHASTGNTSCVWK